MNFLLSVIASSGDEVTKALLRIAIELLAKSIPWLGKFLGGPFGFIVSLTIRYVSDILYELVERAARFGKIEAEWKERLEAAKDAQEKVFEEYKEGELSDETVNQFLDAVSNLGKYRV